MRQRAMIAMALACDPEILIADEPTTALDVTVQAQILDLMIKLKEDFGTAVQMITHDLGVIAEMADRIVVMYAGRVVEQASTLELFQHTLHPLYDRPAEIDSHSWQPDCRGDKASERDQGYGPQPGRTARWLQILRSLQPGHGSLS
jgi:ABC-type glutathione transport system ATPase component